MKMRKQRRMGAVLLLLSALLVSLAAQAGGAPEDSDATAALLTAPLGAYLLFTQQYILYDGKLPAGQQERRLTTWQENESPTHHG